MMLVKKRFRLAIDVGGTFTDFAVIDDESGVVRFGKVLSTPDDPSVGSIEGASQALKRNNISPEWVGEVVHATTVATNAVLERRGANTGLITTKGFRDTLEIGRESRYDIYDLDLIVPEPLVNRQNRVEVLERMDSDGHVRIALDRQSLDVALDQLVSSNIKSIAICFLHSHINSEHEKIVASVIQQRFPEIEISVSSEVAGEVREFERTSTTCVDAYVKPLVRRYIGSLEDGLRSLGMTNNVALMLSHGGIGSARDVVTRFPVRMIESGPAAGAIAAAYFSRQALQNADVIAFDMGGTTAKMSLIRDGAPSVTNEYEVAHVHRFKRGSGIPLQISAVELLEIGAGGGSIARLSKLDLLTVGPESAGAKPGPVCYARGGKEPTVTDADLLLGYLDPEFFLGGEMQLDVQAAREAMQTEIGRVLKLKPEDVALGIHNIVNEHMCAAISAHGAEKGIDLRQFDMIAFGGAGPIHAYAIARKLKLKRILCPYGAGVASAIGCLVAPPAVDVVVAFEGILSSLNWSAAAERFIELKRSATEVIEGLVGVGASISLRPQFEMRCKGQGYSVNVSLPVDTMIDATLEQRLVVLFGTEYEKIYGHLPPSVPIEVVNIRARVQETRSPTTIQQAPAEGVSPGASAIRGVRSAYFEASKGFVSTTVYSRYLLEQEKKYSGPAIIEERETSIVVGPDASFYVDEHGNVIIEFLESSDASIG
jgi:N-methylhydantoinase A